MYVALFALVVSAAFAKDAEKDAQPEIKKQGKRGILGLGYGYAYDGGYDIGAAVPAPALNVAPVHGLGYAAADYGQLAGANYGQLAGANYGHVASTHHEKVITVVRNVPQPYPVEKHIPYPVEKHVPYPVKVRYIWELTSWLSLAKVVHYRDN